MIEQDSTQEDDRLFTVEEVAERLRVSTMTIYRGLQDRTLGLEFIRVGKRVIRVRESALLRFMESNTNTNESL